MVVLEDDKAFYEITDNENIDVNIPVKITVTAENEQIRVYSINVKKDNEILDSNSKLAIFKITGKNIEFDPNVLNYNITIEDETELDIFVLPESDKATYHISGNENLKNKSKITITVKAEDGTESKYTINVKTPSNVDAILIISLISIVAIFVGYKVFRKIFFKEKETTYEYE